MGKMKFTPEQQSVIDARDSSLLISAAAGSGKTAVLVQRVIEKIIDPKLRQEINRLLVVTFTNAAAAQMKERIGARISEVLQSEEYAGDTHLQKQVLLLRNAPIMTIHSFCLSLLREFFYELNLDPSFRIAEEAELILLRADVMERLLERYYLGEFEGLTEAECEERRALFLRLTECLGSGKNDDALVRQIENLYKFSQSAPFPESWLEKAKERPNAFLRGELIRDDDPCMQKMVENMRAAIADFEIVCEQAAACCRMPDGPIFYLEAIESDREFLAGLSKATSYDAIHEAITTHNFAKLGGKRGNTTPEEAKQRVKDLRDVYKEAIKKFEKNYYFATREQMSADMAAMAPLMKLLIELCGEYTRDFNAVKAERGLMDFGDLEHYAVRLLVRETEDGYETTETAKLLRSRFDEIMVDECQDSNLIQDLLLWSVSGEEDGRPNRFMVGDVKQSIYKFRMAKPELFMQKYEEYAPYCAENREEIPQGGRFEKIVLAKNFRSRAAVVDYTNAVFARLMYREFGKIEYDDAAKLYCHADYAPDTEANRTELILTQMESETETDEADTEDTDKIHLEAYSIAARIKKLVADGFLVSDGEEVDADGNKRKKFRPVTYGDITILLRAMSGYAEPFLEVFSELSVPAIADTQTGYFSAQEVAVTMNALRIIDNPRQDIPLVSVLRSEMGAVSEEELAQIRVATKVAKDAPKLSFYEAVCRYQELTDRDEEGQKLQEKLRIFLTRFERLRELSAYAGVPEVLRELFAITKYPEFVRVKQGGERRCDNLTMLVEKARSFEKTSYSGIFDFVRYVDRLIKYESDTGEAQESAGTDAVRLMSIHKSKGLEAPVIIVAGLSKNFNFTDINAEMVIHAELGIGMKFRDEVKRVEAPTLYKKVISEQLKQEMLAEELRVLYVALTRAREKLILSATVKSQSDFLEKAENASCGGGRVRFSQLAGARSYLDFLKPTLVNTVSEELLLVYSATQILGMTEEGVIEEQKQREARASRYHSLKSMETKVAFSKPLADEIARRNAYVYPYPSLMGKRKLSVSELKKAAYQTETQEELFPEHEPEKLIPLFLRGEQEEKLLGSDRGTLYHKVMECMDFTKDYLNVQEVEQEVDRLLALDRIRPDAKEIVSLEKLVQFFSSDIYRRMQTAAKQGLLHKEKPFVIGLPYADIYSDGAGHPELSEEFVMVQGIIDACFEENGALVLLDYKTDRVEGNVREELTKRYRTQLDYYEQALRQTTGKKVTERIIYAFTNGDFFQV